MQTKQPSLEIIAAAAKSAGLSHLNDRAWEEDALLILVQLPAEQWRAIEVSARALIRDLDHKIDHVNQARATCEIGQSAVI